MSTIEAIKPPKLELVATSWEQDAACRNLGGEFTSLFFADELHDIARAKRICATCPVMAMCLETALENREPWGVWGGQLFLNGRVLLSKRRRGRPPKVARAEDYFPDIPIPEHLRSAIA